MTKTTHSVLVAAGIFLAATGLTRAQAPAGRTIHIRCGIAVPSGVTQPVTMMAQIYRVGRNNLGKYQRPTQSQNLIVSLMPGEDGSGAGSFDADLEVGNDIEYEFKVVPLDQDGRERTDGRYYFVGTDLIGDLFDRTVSLQPGQVNEVVVNLRWIPKTQQFKSNFLQVVAIPGHTDYSLAMYLNDPTDIDLIN
jgi:hypothetical protein